MNIKGETVIYRNDKGRYSRRVATQGYENGQKTDDWVSKFIDLQMPKDCDLPTKTKIIIDEGFEKVRKWTDRDGHEHIELSNVVLKYHLPQNGPEGMEEIADPLPF